MLLLVIFCVTLKFTVSNYTTIDAPSEQGSDLEDDEDMVGYDDDAVNMEEFMYEVNILLSYSHCSSQNLRF